ncbi:MAG: family 10 glycosylhydrolase [Flavisolibacter sp.]|jgi:uncharacterized lipoprotein YddW (UPF0748 family)|nr:family 10 glycosylhydrolase [Flavisolibacter sp.]
MVSKQSCIVVLAFLTLMYSCTSQKTIVQARPAGVPEVVREFRAAWVATVANINWPSKPGLTAGEQQREAIELLDFLKNHHFNAVILQVRPQADALYISNLEPWSYFLSGEQGKPPSPYYEPLKFWIDAAHERGLELHVWLNPYRAHHISGGPVTDSSLVKRMAGQVVYLKEGYWWFDPAKQETQDHSANVVMDLVKRYDIDGVHFDDYFYPYPSYNLGEDFPDHESWQAYQAGGGKLERGDWRRYHVNRFIERVYTSIKKEKPSVKFGLSPFGIWRPGYPASIEGFDQYDKLYADAKLWLNKGWIDYFAPQLYWPINRQAQSYPVLLGWWKEENTMGRHLWPGISIPRDTSFRSVNEALSQIMIAKGLLPESPGVIHWSISSVVKNPNLSKALLEGPYKKQALVPASPWLDNQSPIPPVVEQERRNELIRINWTHTHEDEIFRWVVYTRYGGKWNYRILNQEERRHEIPLKEGDQNLEALAITAIDRSGNESAWKEIRFN